MGIQGYLAVLPVDFEKQSLERKNKDTCEDLQMNAQRYDVIIIATDLPSFFLFCSRFASISILHHRTLKCQTSITNMRIIQGPRFINHQDVAATR